MISVTRLDGTQFYVNDELIEIMEGLPDTVLKLTTQHRYIVRESPDEVIERIVEFRRRSSRAFPEVRPSAS